MIYALRRVDLARRLLRLSPQPSPCPRFGLRAQNIEFMFGARLGNMQMREQGKIWRRGSTDRRSCTPANSGMLSPTKRITVSSVLAEGLADNTVILLFGTRADNIRQLYRSRCPPACEGIPGQHYSHLQHLLIITTTIIIIIIGDLKQFDDKSKQRNHCNVFKITSSVRACPLLFEENSTTC